MLRNKGIFKFITALGVSIFLIAFLTVIFRMYYADVCFENAVKSVDDTNYKFALTYINRAVKSNPKEPNYQRLKGKILILLSIESEEDLVHYYKMSALNSLKKALSLNENNLVTIRNCVPLYYYLAVKDYSLSPGSNNIDSEFISYTEDFYKSVKTGYSYDAGVVLLLAKYERRLGLDAEYERSVSLVKRLRPDLLEWHPAFN